MNPNQDINTNNNLIDADKLIDEALQEANQLENLNQKQVRFENNNIDVQMAPQIPNDVATNSPNSMPSNQLYQVSQFPSVEDNFDNIDNNMMNMYSNVSPINTLYDSLKWTLIVVGFIFVFSSPKVLSSFLSFAPSQLKIVTDTGNSLSLVGNIVYLLIPALLFFVLYHFLL
jgi:hypothetical protein